MNFNANNVDDKLIKDSLEFLLTTNDKGASFDYYDDRARKRGYATWLYKHYEELGLLENSWDYLLDEMIKKGYVESFPSLGFVKQLNAKPSQIKISKKGIEYIGKGNEETLEVLEEESITKLQISVLKLQETDLKKTASRRWSDFFRAVLYVIIGAGLTALTNFLQKPPLVQVTNQVIPPKVQIVCDTIYVAIPKSQKKKK